MDPSFWLNRWDQQQIGFHLSEVNPQLVAHWPTLALPAGSAVLVPLCGKSLDLRWLRQQQLRVVGVELAASAVEAFFAEQGLQPQRQVHGAFAHYLADGIEIWQGDFFALERAQLAGCTAFYDRAALIALPPAMRVRYVAHLNALLPPDARGLLVTLDYDPQDMDGPPFAVPPSEVAQHFGDRWAITPGPVRSVLDADGRYRERAMRFLHEQSFCLQRRG